MNFTKDDYETILYSLEGYIQGNDDEELCDRLVYICYRIENKLSDLDDTPKSDAILFASVLLLAPTVTE